MIPFDAIDPPKGASDHSSQSLFEMISQSYYFDETEYVEALIQYLDITEKIEGEVTHNATKLIKTIRKKENLEDSLDALLREYNLSTNEGLVLMCLAEAFLRIPDKPSIDAFIRDRIAGVDWSAHKGQSEQMLVNFATWGLMLTGKIVDVNDSSNALKKLTSRVSEPIIRASMKRAMRIMGKQFVLGETIEEALKNGTKAREAGYTYTFDMLGEAAMTQADADRYYDAYSAALKAVGAQKNLPNSRKPSLSIKLSALHQRYEVAQKDRVMTELFLRVKTLALLGVELDAEISIDAEEMDRLELSLELFEKLIEVPEIRQARVLGLVVQSYSKCALSVLVWVTQLAKKWDTQIPTRLVKGAYWDTEIKASQIRGLPHYPLFTRKESTDISYLACAKYMLSEGAKEALRPQFATHNAHTVTSILQMAGDRALEFQRLHGMGEALYDEIIHETKASVRIYAPVGLHEDLLPYLVRRLLENGANSSFVHQLVDPKVPIDHLVHHPLHTLKNYEAIPNEQIPLPRDLYGQIRQNSKGINLNIILSQKQFMAQYNDYIEKQWQATPIINGKKQGGNMVDCFAPFDLDHAIGSVIEATQDHVKEAIDQLDRAWFDWNQTPVNERAAILERMADALEENMPELTALLSIEAGKTVQDGIDEVREAVDFCRYYASEARGHGVVTELKGASGEQNLFFYEGKGVFACISPWNFPLAIYLGQIVAALVSGNTVLAKPAENTALIAYRALELLFEAGLPKEVIAFLPGSGSVLGEVFTKDHRVVGVCFTGSTRAAQVINQNLAHRKGAIPTLIAETGGQNVMFADSTSLPEQVVADALQSAFITAGQRCSALRVLYLQEEIADNIIGLLKGALNDLVIGVPFHLKTDVSSVINLAAKNSLQAHIDELTAQGKLIAQAKIDPDLNGYFIPPTLFEIASITELEKENFGPILHVIRYKRQALLECIREVNATHYGLTLGIHSRNESLQQVIAKHARVGNLYINRNQVGAVVGVQPFGGQGLSGTGPKAGGPNYLIRFMNERSTSINTAAIGGDAALLTMAHD